MSINKTLDERGSRYGRFEEHAKICQHLKDGMRWRHDATCLVEREGWARLQDDMRQALEVIADKIARILNGDPNYIDNWHDIQGYAKLVEDRLQQAKKRLAMSACEDKKSVEAEKTFRLRGEIIKQQIQQPTHDPVGRPRYVVDGVFGQASDTHSFCVRLGDKEICVFEDERIAHEVAAFLNRSQPGKG